MKKANTWIGAGIVGLLAVGAVAAEPTNAELDQKIKVLEHRLEVADEASAAKAKDAVSVKASKEGFSLNSADKSFQLRLRALVQADGRFFLDDKDQKATDTFLLRRVRPIIDGIVFNDFGFRITPDFGDGKTTVFDAYGEYTPLPEFGIRVGKFRPPSGLERLQSVSDIKFTEFGFPTALVPNRDVGVQFFGDVASGIVQYAVGIFNGVVDGGVGDGDTNDGKDFAGRLFLHPFRLADVEALNNFGIGISASVGDQEGTTTAPNLPSFKSAGQQTVFSYKVSTNANGIAYADGQRIRISPQAYWYVGPFGLLGEYVQSEQDVTNGKDTESVRNTAWQIQGSWVLTGETASYKGVTPRFNYDLAAGHVGALELVGRCQSLEIGDDAFPKFADAKKSISGAKGWGTGLNWYLNKNVRVSLDYEQYSFEGGAATGDRPDEKIIFTRVQLVI